MLGRKFSSFHQQSIQEVVPYPGCELRVISVFVKRQFLKNTNLYFLGFLCAFLSFSFQLKLLVTVYDIILHRLVKIRVLLSQWFPSHEFFHLFLIFEKRVQSKMNQHCCRRPGKDDKTTSNANIVATTPIAAAATSAFAVTFTIATTTATTFDNARHHCHNHLFLLPKKCEDFRKNPPGYGTWIMIDTN